MASRRHPLYSCGASASTIARSLYRRSVEINGPIGSVTRCLDKLGSSVAPSVYVTQLQWLAILSFIDGYILWWMKMVENCIPLSRHVFDKIDNGLDYVEKLPEKVDDAMNKLPVVLHRIPLLEWAVMSAIQWVEFFCSVLVLWGMDNSAKEKEIRVDTNCIHKEQIDQTESLQFSYKEALKCSYKVAEEKGVKKDADAEEKALEVGNGDKDNAAEDVAETKGAVTKDEVRTKEDPLLELFDFGWETPKPNSTILRSDSYT